jgi:protein subunit release factor B
MQENRKVKGSNTTEPVKHEKLRELLNQESILIQQIETLKFEAQEEAKVEKTNRWIEQVRSYYNTRESWKLSH